MQPGPRRELFASASLSTKNKKRRKTFSKKGLQFNPAKLQKTNSIPPNCSRLWCYAPQSMKLQGTTSAWHAGAPTSRPVGKEGPAPPRGSCGGTGAGKRPSAGRRGWRRAQVQRWAAGKGGTKGVEVTEMKDKWIFEGRTAGVYSHHPTGEK